MWNSAGRAATASRSWPAGRPARKYAYSSGCTGDAAVPSEFGQLGLWHVLVAAGAGKQRRYLIPSPELVIVRMGPVRGGRAFTDVEFLAALLR